MKSIFAGTGYPFGLLPGGIHPEPAMCMAVSKLQEKIGNDMTQTTNPT